MWSNTCQLDVFLAWHKKLVYNNPLYAGSYLPDMKIGVQAYKLAGILCKGMTTEEAIKGMEKYAYRPIRVHVKD